MGSAMYAEPAMTATPAAVAAAEPSQSPSTWARAPRSFSDDAPESTMNAARLATPPASATPSISPPATCGGESRRSPASTATHSVKPSRARPFTNAASVW